MAFTDQLGRTIRLKKHPVRIISLVPSQTELLYDLGLDKEVIGITKFCVHPPEWHRNKSRIGGTKNLHIDQIAALQPDLIIGNKEENIKEQVLQLENIAPVWISDVNTMNDAFDMMLRIGELVDRQIKANQLVNDIKNAFDRLNQLIIQTGFNLHPLKVCYLIWKDPYMTAGGDTFISEMIQHCGIQNIYRHETRYPIIKPEELSNNNCNYIFLSSEPYPFNQTHISEIRNMVPTAKICLVNGEMFSWYGSRMLKAANYFEEMIKNMISEQESK